ncbi:AmmeMemoRadiSam system protein B [Propionimicrobium sp. PCR01-08-3]|uniref:AmmeMemoRadiSam system protein B n=1 Tax=Propionimicrobium sp. PCR01-08-3 TaxID=3052086 RepID=UPI00255CD418|nr:AmmeMemoRadiSam system protein B [Propionimicrobium sp. PCR01-08-3]WIY82399.1 AmmeMemoRadiSam system protein B [Propionimicrobium sp. PCR01-08-3]
MKIRPAAVAGTFYPADPRALASMVGQLLDDARPDEQATPPKALICPHAGYIYSGSTAALGYASLRPDKHPIARVVIAGPAHRVGIRGIALPGVDAMATPLGEVPLDLELCQQISKLDDVDIRPDVHAEEHSVEVQLPFLQSVLGEFTVVPLVVGDASPDAVADVLEACAGGPETLLVISSDLSHYHPYDEAKHMDAETLAAICALRGPISAHRACGAHPINGLLTFAGRHDLHPVLLGSRNSGDTAGDKGRVVGYASLAWYQE